MEESQTAWKWECGDRRRPPVESRGNPPPSPVKVREQTPPELNGFLFPNLRYEKYHFLALYLVSNSHSQNTLYCALRLSSWGTNQAMPQVGVRLYLTVRYEKTPLPGTLTCFKQPPLTKHFFLCTKVFFQRNKLGLDKGQYPKALHSYSCEVAFSLVNLWNVVLLIASGVNTDASTWLLPLELFCTCSQT